MSDPAVLLVEDLTVAVTELGVEIVSDVSLSVPPNHTLGIVGESGCGKTTVAMALLGFARPGTQIVGGRVTVDGRDVLSMGSSELSRTRGRVVSVRTPGPIARSLSGDASQTPARGDPRPTRIESRTRGTAPRSMEGAQLPYTEEMLGRYPHQLCGASNRESRSRSRSCVSQPRRDGRADDRTRCLTQAACSR